MFSASLSCDGCFASYEIHGTLEEIGGQDCLFCGSQLVETITTSPEVDAAEDQPSLVIKQGPSRELVTARCNRTWVFGSPSEAER